MLDDAGVEAQVRDLWSRHVDEKPRLDRIYDFARGLRGVPPVPEGSGEELRDIAKLSVKNVISLVEDSFGQNLAVVGYRSVEATQNTSAWRIWQEQGMDARQAEVHRPAIRYGASYLLVAPEVAGGRAAMRPRTPRQMIAIYADAQMDRWPLFALETWVDTSEAKPRRKGLLVDAEACYPLDLGEVSKWATRSVAVRVPVEIEGDPWAHRGREGDRAVCPVVRFVEHRRAEVAVVGEVEPLINPQMAINAVNFDRLVVSRFGAFPQKYTIGWTSSADQVLKAAMSRVWTFEDDTVKLGAFPAASVEPYNALLEEMQQHVAMMAQVTPASVTGKMVNLSADALAAAEKAQQRKLYEIRQSLGESWEQALRLAATIDGDPETAADDGAEVVWADTEARAFGAVVDGITKLAAVGVPIDELVTLVPGLSQQQITSIRDRVAGTSAIVQALRELSQGQPRTEPEPAPEAA